ncbi:hypothetical protein Tco_1044829 [Tanacetum coccineum]|uniref:Uncharacterized protein n=1 Tax=Tanacetum coccineum TaxID=301880 RepID=A0ABQ5GS38_9ASTR
MVYQNFLREFWSTAIAFDPFPSTDEPEKRPLKEFLIKFLALNRQKPLNLDFHTFCSPTGLNYNNSKYVAHPTPEVVKKELGKIAINLGYLDKTQVLKNSFPVAWRILFTFVIQDSVSLPPLVAKPKKGKSLTMASTLPKLQGLEASGSLFKKRKQPKPKRPPTKTKESPPKPTKGLPSTLDEGTRQSKPFPEGTATHPKDLYRNKQPLNRDITSMTSNEGMAKTKPHPEGSLGDKDSGGNIPPADMEQIHTPVADPSRTGAKYQLDETQSTRLRYQSLTENKGKTSSEVEPDTEPLKLQTYADIQAFLLFDDELDKDSDEEEVLAAGDDKAAVLYADHKASIDHYYDENIAHRDQTNKLVEASMSSLDRSNTTISELYKGLNAIIDLLKDISNDKEEQIKKAEEEAKLLAMTKPEVIKVVQEEAEKIGLDPKAIKGAKAGENIQDPSEQHKPIEGVVIIVYKGTDGRNFKVHEPFLFGAFGISELDELREIIPKKKNAVVKDLMNSLSQRYERLKKIPKELGIHSTLPAPAPKQASSRSSGRKQKHMELKPETRIL